MLKRLRWAATAAAVSFVQFVPIAGQASAFEPVKVVESDLPANLKNALEAWAVEESSRLPMIGPRGYGVPAEMQAAIARLKVGDRLPYGFKPMNFDDLVAALHRDRPPVGPKTKFETEVQYAEREAAHWTELGIDPEDSVVVLPLRSERDALLEYDPEKQGYRFDSRGCICGSDASGPANRPRLWSIVIRNNDAFKAATTEENLWVPMESKRAQVLDRKLSAVMVGRLVPPVIDYDLTKDYEAVLLQVEATSLLVLNDDREEVLARVDIPDDNTQATSATPQ